MTYSSVRCVHTCLLVMLTNVAGVVADPEIPRDQVSPDGYAYLSQFAVHVPGGIHAARGVAKAAMMNFKGQIGSLDYYYLFEWPDRHKRSSSLSLPHHKLLTDHPSVKWFEQQTVLSRQKRDFLPKEHKTTFSRQKRDVIHREHKTTLSRQKREFNPEEEGAIAHLTDPQWSDQWYLDAGGQGGHDMNVIAAWREGVTG